MISEDKIIDYLEGRLSAVEQQEVDIAISESPELQASFEAYKALLTELDEQPEYQPSQKLSQGFYDHLATLESEPTPTTKTRSIPYRRLLQIAAASLIFIIGISLGKYITQDDIQKLSQIEQELKNTQTIMLEMLKKESASQRIKAVNFSYDMNGVDQKVVDALIQTMNFDKNLNVRLHAAEALARFGKEDKVRDAFILTLARPDNPEMQIKAINILVHLKEERAVGELLKLLDQENLIDPVKQSAQDGLNILL